MWGRFRGSGQGHNDHDAPPSDPYGAERANMLETQLVARQIRDEHVLDAMRRVPRHAFIPEAFRKHAYEDHPIEIGGGQTISQPYMVALMTQILQVQPNDHVLEIGTGSGYQTAILCMLARRVTSIERIASLADKAASTLCALEYHNAEVRVGDGTIGCYEEAPYNAIIVTAAAPSIPAALRDQLADRGRLVCPVGPRDLQLLVRVVRRGNEFVEDESVKCVFVPLIGEAGWPG